MLVSLMSKFKNEDSIGDNCEVGANLARFGITDGDLLRYALSNIDAVEKLFRNRFHGLFEELYSGSNGKLVFCKKYNIGFHTKFTLKNNNGNYYLDDKTSIYKDEYIIEKSKIDYLVKRLLTILNGLDSTLFVYKSSNFINYNKLNEFSDTVSSLYSRLPFKILVLKTKMQEAIGEPGNNINVRYLDYIAPNENTIKGGDWNNWSKALDEHTAVIDSKLEKLNNYLKLGESPAALFRDIALILENYGEIDTALWLMKKAQVLSPSGSIINSKIAEYEAKK